MKCDVIVGDDRSSEMKGCGLLEMPNGGEGGGKMVSRAPMDETRPVEKRKTSTLDCFKEFPGKGHGR